MGILKSILGDLNKRALNKLKPLVLKINNLESWAEKLSDEELKKEANNLKEAIGKRLEEGDKLEHILDHLIPETFALVREASRRAIGQRHFDVQLLGGVVLHQGKISEMKTGEGKTLVATLPLVLNALAGKGAHLVTVNDYLARRDAGWMGPIYHMLGLSTGVIIHEEAFVYDPDFINEKTHDDKLKHLKPVTRREAYEADITYGTNNEFGFDYLRDNMVQDLSQMAQRPLHYAIVDEVDSILIDEARTPLIISAPAEESTEKYYQFAKLVNNLKEESDYRIDEKLKAATLTEEGISKMEQLLGLKNIYEEKGIDTVHHLEQALKARALFQKDRDYVVKDGEVIIVDEFTGRLMFGRRYSEGLHQAIEAKEGVEIKRESLTLATISFQNYFRIYKKLAGMTGTAVTEAEEFAKIYNLEVLVIPTHNPMVRKDKNDLIYKNFEAKMKAVADEIEERYQKGQPVLVGTVSIDKNEYLSEILNRRGIPHQLLNAKHHEREAEIISQAGRLKAVTVATNMAGRGVDIILGGNPPDEKEAKKIKELDGLFVLGTERHEARRIDNQLRGRSGRQGDPGESRFFVSLEDDLMRIFGSEKIASLMTTLRFPENQPIEHPLISKSLESAQRKVEGHNFDIRKHLVEYDDVMNKHREVIYKRRREILDSKGVKEDILAIFREEAEQLTNNFFANSTPESLEFLIESLGRIFDLKEETKEKIKSLPQPAMVEILSQEFQEIYEEKEKEVGGDLMRMIEKAVYLRMIDNLWVEHLDAMEHLREGIGLRGYGQRDPLIEYKHEAFGMFRRLEEAIRTDVLSLILRVTVTQEEQESAQNEKRQENKAPAEEKKQDNLSPQNTSLKSQKKVGRNDPCFCGAVDANGKPVKYKRCHGR